MVNSKDELRDISHWDYEYIIELINKQTKESIRLEYKRGDWLKNTERGKCDLRKWVTSFANSAGGFFVIGVSDKEINNERLPDTPDGVEKNKFGEDNAKWIEDVILNSIFPHLNPVPRIKVIAIPKSNKEIVAMWIPQTIAVLHKVTYHGKDHYFHRHEYQVIEMDEWEIRALLFGRKPPPVFEIKWDGRGVLCQFESVESAKIIKHDFFVLRLVNNGFGIGKNIHIGIISPTQYDFELFEPRYVEVGEFFRRHETPVRFRREVNFFAEILSSQLEQFFDIKPAPKQYQVIKIYEDLLHSGDSVNYVFKLKLKVPQDSNEIRVNMGVYCLSEDSHNRYFGMEIKISEFNTHRNTAELEVEIREYLEGEKIPVSISAV